MIFPNHLAAKIARKASSATSGEFTGNEIVGGLLLVLIHGDSCLEAL